MIFCDYFLSINIFEGILSIILIFGCLIVCFGYCLFNLKYVCLSSFNDLLIFFELLIIGSIIFKLFKLIFVFNMVLSWFKKSLGWLRVMCILC